LVAEFESDVGASGIKSRADARGDGERGDVKHCWLPTSQE
jgi:hypothetical protein